MKLKGQVRRVRRKVNRWSGTRQTPKPTRRKHGYSRAKIRRTQRSIAIRSVMFRGLYA